MSSTNSIDISCFDNIIGLSRTDCPCFDENNFNESKSNIFLDELDGLNLNMANAYADCDKGTLWELLENARHQGIMRFLGDTNAALGQMYSLKRQPYNGMIGQATFKNSLSFNNTYVYERFFCADVVSGKIKIKGIGTCFEQTGTITLWIYDNENTLLYTLTLNTEAGKHKLNTFATPIELELHGNYVDNREYYFVYAYDNNNKPKDTKVSCGGCDGFRPSFDINNPYCVTEKSHKKYGWANWIMAAPGSTNTLDFMCDNCIPEQVSSYYTNGLTFDVELSCNVNEVVCKDSFDFVTNPVGLASAHAIRYAAGMYFVMGVLASNNVNRYTMSNNELYQALYLEYQKEFVKRIEWVSKTVSISANDCYECKDKYLLTRGQILV